MLKRNGQEYSNGLSMEDDQFNLSDSYCNPFRVYA